MRDKSRCIYADKDIEGVCQFLHIYEQTALLYLKISDVDGPNLCRVKK